MKLQALKAGAFLVRHTGKVVSFIVGALVAGWLTGQGVSPVTAQQIGQQVGHAAGTAAQEIAEGASEQP